MTNISLRDYFREIDDLILNGQYSPAIDHCKYILKTYPKALDAYRLFGKASLENKDLPQATDAFERALAIRPDDFIAHVGLSCIREEENNLDAAIWHMERAFEMDSSSIAIQGELKRLYTLRDGESPQKIRLTKGALVRMYLRGGMLQQAISEIQLNFTADEERLDIQVVLASLFLQTGQKKAAIELCHEILAKLPYCFDANLILLNSLDSQADNVEATIYRERLIEMDPYFAFVKSPGQDITTVPNEAVILRKYDQDGSVDDFDLEPIAIPAVENQPEEDVKMPDWFSEESQALQQSDVESPSIESSLTPPSSLEETSSEELPSPAVSQNGTEMIKMDASPGENGKTSAPINDDNNSKSTTPSPESELPEWLHELEWKSEEPLADQDDQELNMTPKAPLPDLSVEDINEKKEDPLPESNIQESKDKSSESALPADIPDWVQGMAPPISDTAEQAATELAENADLSEILFTEMDQQEMNASVSAEESLSTLPREEIAEEISPEPAVENESIPDWLQGFDPSISRKEEKAPENDLPDWLDAEDLTSSSAQNNPFTLDSISDLKLEPEESAEQDEFPGTAPLPPESVEEFEKPEWLREETQANSDVESLFSQPVESAGEPLTNEFSNWLDNLRPEAEAAAPESEEKDLPEGLPDWLIEPESQLGDTEPVAIKKPDSPEIDAWMPEHIDADTPLEQFEAESSSPASNESDIPEFLSVQNQMAEREPAAKELQPDDISTPETPESSPSFIESPAPLIQGNVDSLIEQYNQKLHLGQNLPELIDEIKQLTEDLPSEPGLWLLLGDAYHGNKQVQAALDAYTRAEEFLS